MSYAATATAAPAFLPPSAASSASNGGSAAQFQRNLNVHLICPDCREVPPNLVENFSDGDMVCGSCGVYSATCYENIVEESVEKK